MTDENRFRQFVIDHPEIEHSVLIFVWDREVVRETELGDTLYFCENICYERRDPDYSCIGDRADLLKFAADYVDIWNMKDTRIRNGILFGYMHGIGGDGKDDFVDGDLFQDSATTRYSIYELLSNERTYLKDLHRGA